MLFFVISKVEDVAGVRGLLPAARAIAASVVVQLLATPWPSAHAAAVEDVLDRFPPPRQDFERHVEEVRAYLLDTQLEGRQPSDVEYNVPFELHASAGVPYRGKYLLVHGLNDSPAVWYDVARALMNRGFDVRAILLPGHGNTPEAQLHVSWEQWLSAARMHLAYWRSPDVPMYLGGFSLGGVIATLLALEDDGIDLQRAWNGRTLTMPVLMVETVDDSVVDVDATRHVIETRFDSQKRKLLLYANDPIGPTAHEIVRPSRYPGLRIINQSHQGMMASPQNALFGEHGTQLVCNGNEWPVFSACLYYTKGPHWHGAEGTASPDGVPVARTTFNPDFDGVMALHDEVFAIDPIRQEPVR